MADVSVIIVTRNTYDLTCLAVRSVLDHGNGFGVEIFVVDNGSTDGTCSLLQKQFPSIKVLRSSSNLGFAKAVNLAAGQTRGDFILLMNSDTTLHDQSLRMAIQWMRGNPRCGVVGAQLLNPDGSRQNSIANFPTLATELLNKSLLRRIQPKRYPGKERIFESPIEVETVIGAFMLVRRELWESIRGLDERFFFFLEETDFCLRARQQGWHVMHLPNVLVGHGRGQSAKQVLPAARVEYWRSRYAYFEKHHGPSVRMVLQIGLSFRLLVDWLIAILAVGLTLGRNERWRSRLEVCSTLVMWHLRGCHVDFGLPR